MVLPVITHVVLQWPTCNDLAFGWPIPRTKYQNLHSQTFSEVFIKICMVNHLFFLFLVAVISRQCFLVLRCLSLLSSVLSASLEDPLQGRRSDFFIGRYLLSLLNHAFFVITIWILLTFVVLMNDDFLLIFRRLLFIMFNFLYIV